MKSGRKALIGAMLASLAMAATPSPAAAQDSEARLRKIETEVRALQRTVFPGGDGRFFTPEVITPQGQTQPQPQVGTPSTTALVDILSRLDTLEGQLAMLTARTEENDNAIRQLRVELEAMRGGPAPAVAATIPAMPTSAPAAVASTPRPVTVATPTPAATAPRPATTTAPRPATGPATGPTAERLARVQAVLKPATADAADDEYVYGFRLWEAKLYPEAEQQLASFLQKYPRHTRVSYARNLLGRAYLDDGKPREAATHFFENYQSNKQADRAPDSLLYLAEAMIRQNDTNRACIALAEFGETYPTLATGRLKTQYDGNRAKVRCN